MIHIPTHRQSTHPGEILPEEVLNPMGLTQRELANAIHIPYQQINDIVNFHRSITPSTTLRLAKFFNLSAEFWIYLQVRKDKHFAQQMRYLSVDSHFHSCRSALRSELYFGTAIYYHDSLNFLI